MLPEKKAQRQGKGLVLSQILHSRILILTVEFPHRVRIKFWHLTRTYGQNYATDPALQLLGRTWTHPSCTQPVVLQPPRPSHPAHARGFNFPPGSPPGQANLQSYFFFLSSPPSKPFLWSKVSNLTALTWTEGTASRSPVVAKKCICGRHRRSLPRTKERQSAKGFPPLCWTIHLKKQVSSKAGASFPMPTTALAELLGIQEAAARISATQRGAL